MAAAFRRNLRRSQRTNLSGEIFEESVLADPVLEAELLPELHADLVAALPDLDGDDLARHLCRRRASGPKKRG